MLRLETIFVHSVHMQDNKPISFKRQFQKNVETSDSFPIEEYVAKSLHNLIPHPIKSVNIQKVRYRDGILEGRDEHSR